AVAERNRYGSRRHADGLALHARHYYGAIRTMRGLGIGDWGLARPLTLRRAQGERGHNPLVPNSSTRSAHPELVEGERSWLRVYASTCEHGYTFIELLVVATIVMILASAIMPLAKVTARRMRAAEVHRVLREM